MLTLSPEKDLLTLSIDGTPIGNLHYITYRDNHPVIATSLSADGNAAKAVLDGIIIEDTFALVDGLITVSRVFTVTTPGKYRFAFTFHPALGDIEDWTVPAVMLRGNQFGEGKFPRGTYRDGWSFREDRIPIPACSILRDNTNFCAVFTSPAKSDVDTGSVKTGVDTSVYFEICAPYAEEPYSFTEKGIVAGGLTKPRKKSFTVRAKDLPYTYTREFYIRYANNPQHPTDVFKDIFDRAWKLFTPASSNASPGWGEYAGLKLYHLRFLTIDDAKTGITGIKMGKGNAYLQSFYEYTSGSFLEKSLEAATIYARAGIELDDAELTRISERIATFFAKGSLSNGLHQDKYDLRTRRFGGYFGAGIASELNKGVNTRSNGEVMTGYLRLYRLLDHAGIKHPEYLETAKNNADFYLSHQLDNGSFGRWWTKDGKPINTLGTNGAYIINFLIELEKTGIEDERIPGALKKAGNYYEWLIDSLDFYGDTLDADCIDKEAGCALLTAFLNLYERDPRAQYLRAATHAANYVLAWMWTYDVAWPKKSELANQGVHTRGLTAVSVAHHHLDMYGMLIGYDFLRLWQAGGDESWKDYALALCEASTQLTATREQRLGRSAAFLGWQPEQIDHTAWDYLHRFIRGKGSFHTCCAWSCVLTLGALLDIRERFPEIIDFKIKPVE